MAPFHFGWGILLLTALVAIDLLARGAALLVRYATVRQAQAHLSHTTPRQASVSQLTQHQRLGELAR